MAVFDLKSGNPVDLPEEDVSRSESAGPSEFHGNLDRLISDAPGKVWVNSGYRSNERQAQLYDAAIKKYGSETAARHNVAPPGRSMHNHDLASDLGYESDDVKKWVHENAANYGLHFPMGHEPWHVEPIGARRRRGEYQPTPASEPPLAAGIKLTDDMEFEPLERPKAPEPIKAEEPGLLKRGLSAVKSAVEHIEPAEQFKLPVPKEQRREYLAAQDPNSPEYAAYGQPKMVGLDRASYSGSIPEKDRIKADPDLIQLHRELGVPVKPEYMDRVRDLYEAATPDQRKRFMGEPGPLGAVSRYFDKKYQGGSIANPDLGGRVEDIASRNRGNGMEPKSAQAMAEREADFNAAPIKGQAQSTDFNFERSNELRNASPITRGAIQGGDILKQQAAGLNKMVADVGESLGVPGAAGYGRAQLEARKRLGMRQTEMGEAPNDFNRNLEGAIASTISNAPGYAVGLFTGGQTIPLLMMSSQVAGDEYANGIEHGLSKPQALTRSVGMGAAEYLGEKLGFKDQVNMLKRAAGGNWRDFEKQFVKTMAEQIAGEEGTTLAQFGIDKSRVGLNPEATAQDLFKQVKDTLHQTIIQTALMGAPGSAAAVHRRLQESDARHDQPFADAFAPVRETHESRAIYDDTIKTPLSVLRTDPGFRQIVQNDTNEYSSGLERGRAARQELAKRRALDALSPAPNSISGQIESPGIQESTKTQGVSNAENPIVQSSGSAESRQAGDQEIESQQNHAGSTGSESSQGGQTQEGLLTPYSVQKTPDGKFAVVSGNGNVESIHDHPGDAFDATLAANQRLHQEQESQDGNRTERMEQRREGDSSAPGKQNAGMDGRESASDAEAGADRQGSESGGHRGLSPRAQRMVDAMEQDALKAEAQGDHEKAQYFRDFIKDITNDELMLAFVPREYEDAVYSKGSTGSGTEKTSGGKRATEGSSVGTGTAAVGSTGRSAGGGTGGVSESVSTGAGDAGDRGDSGHSLGKRKESEAPVIQNRDRSNPASIQQMQSIAANPHYLRLGPGNDFANGAPVVVGGDIPAIQLGNKDIAVTAKNREIPFQYAVIEAYNLVPSHKADGSPNLEYDDIPKGKFKVIAGNGRVAGLQKAHQQGSAFNYVHGMYSDQHRHGIEPTVVGGVMSKPILVRVMSESDLTKDIGDESNIGNGLELSPLEKAKNDSQRIDLGGLDFNDDGEINERTVKQFVRTMPENEQGALLDTDGTPNRDAYDRLKAAIFFKAYRNDELVRLFSQAADPEARLVMSALARVAPKMARLEGTGYEDISDLVAEAAISIVNGKRSGLTMQQIAKQIDITHQPGTADILALFADNPRSNKMAIEALTDVADFAFEESNNPGEDLFGERQKATRQDVLDRLRKYRGQQEESLEHAGGSESPEGNDGTQEAGREGQGDAETIQRGEQEGQGGEKALAPIKERRAARKARKDAFATPEEEQQRVNLVWQIRSLRTRLPRIKSKFDQKQAEKEIARLEKELSKIPQGILTRQGALNFMGKSLDGNKLLDIYLEGAHQRIDDAKPEETAEDVWAAYNDFSKRLGEEAPISEAYFRKELAARASAKNVKQSADNGKADALSPEEIADDQNFKETEGLIEQVRSKYGDAKVQGILEQAAKDMTAGKGQYFPLVRKSLEQALSGQTSAPIQNINYAAYQITGQPAYETHGPLSHDDALFELDVLRDEAKKGKLTPQRFANSEIGQRLDTGLIGEINNQIKVNEFGWIDQLADRIRETSKQKGVSANLVDDLFGAPTKEDQQRSDKEAVEAYAKEKARQRNATGQEVSGGLFDQDNRQADVFSEPSNRIDRLKAAEKPAAPTSEGAQKAQADLDDALKDLGQVFLDANLFVQKAVPTNELDEAKLIPVLARLLDAAFRLGYHKFKDASKFALDTIRAKFGDAAADSITLDHLQGSYIAMSGKYRDQGADTKKDVVSVESLAEIHQGETNVTDRNSDSNLERDRENADAQNGLGQEGVRSGSARNGGVRGTGIQQGEGEARTLGSSELHGREATPPREPSDLTIYRGSTESADSDAGDRFGSGGDLVGVSGSPVEPNAAGSIKAAARSRSEVKEDQAEQTTADAEKHNGEGLDEIKAALPALLPGQQEDVLKAEKRFSAPDGYGMLFTNGTGTGKTFTGLGVIKRFANLGKTNIIILAPNDKIIEDWIKSGKILNLPINRLDDTKDAGKGITITTYANFGSNSALADRNWDLTVTDEAHYLMQDGSGKPTQVIQNLRAITKHPNGAYRRAEMLHRDLRDEIEDLSKQVENANKTISNSDTMDSTVADLQKLLAVIEPKLAAAGAKWAAALEKVKADVAASQNASRPRSLFLSATPFAYEPTVDWANGYLFDYSEGQSDESKEFRGYNQGSNKDRFFMTHFGYRMRYNKLTKPDAKVDSGLMQRQFNTWLKKRGSLSGRMLDVAADYDRRFILVESAIGTRIDQALEWFHDEADRIKDEGGDPNGVGELEDAVGDKFDYLSRRYLLEAIKASEVIKHVKEHMAIGRKVVVFHDYKKGGGFHPFRINRTSNPLFNEALDKFNAEFKDLIGIDFASMPNPIEVFKREFPDVLLFNGDVPAKVRRANVEKFQDDASGPQVILVQSAAGKEGISLHDTTGKHQRVLLNLGQPTQPTTAIQQEGRIYRTGQVTDAIFRYLNTGTNWEKWAFATTIAQRASAAENLGMGEQARALKDAFIAGFEESGDYPAGMEDEGKGGKERDRLANEALTEWDRAKAFYYGTQKKTSKTKAQEGADYFATPEPLGLKMVEWLQLLPGEKALEPSAGHGAIARWLPENTERTAVEPSRQLLPKLAMVFDGKIVDTNFEQLNIVNKFDGIVMNPPFGSGGKTAVDHLAKAAQHLRDGGRIVALIPAGPAADKQLDKFLHDETRTPIEPTARTKELGPVYVGDTIKTSYAWMPEGKVIGTQGDQLLVRRTGANHATAVNPEWVTELNATGRREKVARRSENLYTVADIYLPSSVFERAGTSVNTHIVVLEKQEDPEKAKRIQQSNRDYSGAKDINEFFDRIEESSLPARIGKEATSLADQVDSETKPTPKGQVEGNRYVTDAPAITHTTMKGKTIEGVIANDLTPEEAQAIDPYTWKKDGGFFIRMKHVDRPQPMFSRSEVFFSALERGINSSKIETQPASQWRAWLQSNKAKLGIKDDEIAWTGLDDYLTLKGKERLSKADIAAFLKDNGVQVNESVRMPIEEMTDNQVREIYEAEYGDDGMSVAQMRDWLFDIAEEGTWGTPRYRDYTIPGGQDYRELLITLPTHFDKEAKSLESEIRGLGINKPLKNISIQDLINAGANNELVDRFEKSLTKSTGSTYSSGHWSERNVLAHVRFNDRTDADGKKVLFIEEIQSDWAQEGRKKGFKGEKVKGYEVSWEGRPIMIYETKEEAEAHVERALRNDSSAPVSMREVMAQKNAQQESGKIAAAPFVADTKSWVSLAIKRMIRYAAEGGYDKIAFVNGEQSAARYDLSSQIDRLDLISPDRSHDYFVLHGFKGDEKAVVQKVKDESQLQDYVGKEIAERLLSSEPSSKSQTGRDVRSLSGVDLKVGGEGMKSFYDKIVPQIANDVLKKLGGGRMESVTLRNTENDFDQEELDNATPEELARLQSGGVTLTQPGFVITPAMRDKAMAGLPLFVRNVRGGNPAGLGFDVVDKAARVIWDKLGIAPGVNLRTVKTESDLPKEVLDRAAKEGALGTIEAVEHKGTVYLVADKHTSLRHVEESILHEEAHLGGRLFYGRDILKMYTRLYFALGREAGIRGWANRLGFSMDSYFKTASDMVKAGTMHPTQQFTYLADEFLAHAQGMKAYQSLPAKALQLIKEILGAIRNWLKTKGFIESSKLNDADIAYLLRNLHRAAQGRGVARAGEPVFKRSGDGSDIRFARKNVLGDEPAATWTSPGATSLDDFIYRMQDKLIDTKRVQEAIKGIEDEWNPYQKEMLYHGRAAKQTEDFLTNEVKPLVKAMQDKGVSMDDLETYLWNRHAQERNEQIAKINPKMLDGGSGILTQDAQDYLKGLSPEKQKDLEALAGLVDKINSNTKKILIDSGLEVPETIAAWDEAYKFYVPLMRGESDISNRGNGTGQGFSVRGPASKRAMGSDKPVVDIIANILMQRERTIVRAEKNRVGVALYGLAIQNENPNFWLPVNPEAIRAPRRTRNELQMMGLQPDEIDGLMREPATRYIDQQTGLVAARINPALRNRDNVLAVRVNGKDRFIFFNTGDPRAARMVESLKNLDSDQLGSFLSGVRMFTHTFASMNTQYNPIFGVVNLLRDLGAGALNLTSTEISGKEKDVLAHVGPAIVGIYADLRADRAGRPRSAGQWAKLWEDFQEHGGKTGYRDNYRTSEDRAIAIQRMLDPSSWADHGLGRFFTADGRLKVPMEMVRKAASPLVTPLSGWLSDFNETTENAIRLSAYKVAIDAGISTDKAAAIAKNLTVNFNKKGQLASQLGALYAFFNANAQGTARILETLNGPAGKKIIAGGLLVGVLQAVMMAAAGYDDDEPPQFTRERNFVIPVGDNYFSVPYALGYHVLPNTGRILMELVLSGGKHAGDKVFDLMAAYIESFNPMGSGKSISEVLSPTITDPIVALERNTDAFGRPIAKQDRSGLDPTPGFTRSKDTASLFGKWFAKVINTLTGGDDYKPGRVSPTPDQIDYLIGQATGGVGREAIKAEQAVGSLFTGEQLPPYKIPLAGRFYGNAHSASAERDRFYRNVTELNVTQNEIEGLKKAHKQDELKAFKESHPESKLIRKADDVERRLTLLNARKRFLQRKGDSKDEIKKVESRISDLMKDFNDQVKQVAK